MSKAIRGYAILVALAGCDTGTSLDTCATAGSASGTIITNRNVPAGATIPVPLPIVSVENPDTDVPIVSVTATAEDGTVITGQLVNPTLRRWELDAYPSDLDHFRGPDGFTATLHLVGTDLCKQPHSFDTSTVVLGPRPNAPISNLKLQFEESPASCSLPIGVPRKVKVVAGADGRGASIVVSAFNGVLENGQSTITVALKPSTAGVASDPFTFVPTTAGVATLSAYWPGSSDTESFDASGAPTGTISTGATAIARGATSFVDVSTFGVFSSCYVTESVTGITTLYHVQPDGSLLAFNNGQLNTTCNGLTVEKLAIAFNDQAPDGANASVRCNDPYGRSVSIPVSVANRPPQVVPVTGLSLNIDTLPDACYVPVDGQATPLVIVNADASCLGGSVTLSASHGTWASGQSTTTVPLTAGGSNATASSLFLPTSAGIATIVASANGSPVQTRALAIAAPPTATPSSQSVARGASAFVDFDTRGRFDNCVVSASDAGSVDVEALDPAVGQITTEVAIPHSASDCTEAHHARFSVTFGTSAPTGASVALRCFETAYGRSVATVINVAN
jgi:hypothetical protein